MSLAETLRSAGFDSALIIDDAFDEAPLAADLDSKAWDVFFDDADDDQWALIKEAYPQCDGLGRGELRNSDEFTRAAFKLKGTLGQSLWDTLFIDFERSRALDRQFLEKLTERLEAIGLRVFRAARSIPDEARACKLVFADLFLDPVDRGIERSVELVKELEPDGRLDPPAVVLMSRSPFLEEKREKFRDDAKTVGAMFRVYRKDQLSKPTMVETVLERLATHYGDACRIVRFLNAWEKGTESAMSDFMTLVRRLDLPDYVKIREALLDSEGQHLGSYIIDVFDRILQYQIEERESIIEAAEQLNEIGDSQYPAVHHMGGSPDFQQLAARVIWQNPKRLRLKRTQTDTPVSFGDLLIRQGSLNDRTAEDPPAHDRPDALVVLTRECDLIRKPKTRIMLVGGSLKEIDSGTWKYTESIGEDKTPIVLLPGQLRRSIQWDLNDLQTVSADDLRSLSTGDTRLYSISARFRESSALALQQCLLARMGRVALLGTAPFAFPVRVRVYRTDEACNCRKVDAPVTEQVGAVLIVGRNADNTEFERLVFNEASIDEITGAVQDFQPEQLNARTRETLKRLKESSAFPILLQRGLDLPKKSDKTLADLAVPKADGGGKEVVGLIGSGLEEPPSPLDSGRLAKAALIILFNRPHQPEV